MVSQWDPDKLKQEEATLDALATQPLWRRFRGYAKLTGPGWMQSAMTLGGGSAAASVVAGYGFGYDLLWVQPLAMIAGIIMLAAISNVVLSTGERPYAAMRREVNVPIAFLWGLATLAASIIWHFPQYTLAASAVFDLSQAAGVSEGAERSVKWATGAVVLVISIIMTWNYGSNAAGLRFYEGLMRWVVRLIILAFLIVVVFSAAKGYIDFGAVLTGFTAFRIPEGSTIVILGAFGAAVGINMTFLYPYTLLAKGWGPKHRGLARTDLFMSLFVPYIVTTSLIVIAMAATRSEVMAQGVPLERLTPVEAAGALQTVFGGAGGRIIFDLGLLGFAVTSITTHMVVCGFCACEMFGLEYTVKRYRLFSLIPVIGVLGVALPFPLWMPILASAVCLPMLLIAYVAFFIMNNKRSFLGKLAPRGARRLIWNVLMLGAMAATLVGLSVKFKGGVIDAIRKQFVSATDGGSAPKPPRPA